MKCIQSFRVSDSPEGFTNLCEYCFNDAFAKNNAIYRCHLSWLVHACKVAIVVGQSVLHYVKVTNVRIALALIVKSIRTAPSQIELDFGLWTPPPDLLKEN